MNFGKTIGSLREKWRIEQQDLAKAIGVSKTYVSIIESGNRKPSLRILKKIADYFEVPLSFLLYDASKEGTTKKSKGAKGSIKRIDPIINELADFLMSKAVEAKGKGAGIKKRKSLKRAKS